MRFAASAPSADHDPDRTRSEVGDLTTGGFTPGTVLAGKYRLELVLGEGGMGFVWSAYHLELELPVAVKLLRAGSKNEKLAERLRREARAAAHLVHPSIIRVFDIAVTDAGDPFIVMELLSGESLRKRLGRGRLSSVKTVQLLLPIADALAEAHDKGIVHRDLKPDNVFLTRDGDQLLPKLLDFGIVKLEHPSPVSKLTDRGTVLGSPAYMSPEQVRGESADARSDIWSFCVVLYKAISGAAPFVGVDKCSVMHAIITREPSSLGLAGVDEQLAQLIHRGLSKDPSLRPQSMRELGGALARWLAGRGVTVDACGMPLSSKWLRATPIPDDPVPLSGPPPSAQLTVPFRRPRSRHWTWLTAVAMLIASSGVVRTDSIAHSDARADIALPSPPEPAVPLVLVASQLAPRVEAPAPAVVSEASIAPARTATRAPKLSGAKAARTVPAAPSRRLPF